ncbi:MAG: carboxylating nicotinate-nucleotide diphosphorylase [Deltaproteobacteria bacterium]|nr:carboxylating nicotinate-nucleotide diphosphorylase [Deltaproteobacteria bacterium]
MDPLSRRLIALALEEDIASGDVTSEIIPEASRGRAFIVAREPMILAGTDAFIEVMHQVDPRISVLFDLNDGADVDGGEVVGSVDGPSRTILQGERTALNLLQRLSGIATMANAAQQAVAGTKARVVDTRKTTPGMRILEKKAVRAGGAYNHRIGLFDGVLIKDNHIAALGSIGDAVRAAQASTHHLLKIECEVTHLAGVDEALAAGADVILLDNMDLEVMRTAVERIHGRALVEASGGVTLDRLRAIAETGVDLISMGALTHSARAVDLALEWGDPEVD